MFCRSSPSIRSRIQKHGFFPTVASCSSIIDITNGRSVSNVLQTRFLNLCNDRGISAPATNNCAFPSPSIIVFTHADHRQPPRRYLRQTNLRFAVFVRTSPLSLCSVLLPPPSLNDARIVITLLFFHVEQRLRVCETPLLYSWCT